MTYTEIIRADAMGVSVSYTNYRVCILRPVLHIAVFFSFLCLHEFLFFLGRQGIMRLMSNLKARSGRLAL